MKNETELLDRVSHHTSLIRINTSNYSDTFRNTGVINTATTVKAASGKLLGWNILNNTAALVFVKFYDGLAANVTVGTTIPVLTIQVSANGTVFQPAAATQYNFGTGITVAAVTGFLDTDATSPGASKVIVELKYI